LFRKTSANRGRCNWSQNFWSPTFFNYTGDATLDNEPIQRTGGKRHTPIGKNALYGTISRMGKTKFVVDTTDFNLQINIHVVNFAIQHPGMIFYGTNCLPAFFNIEYVEKNYNLDMHGLLGQTEHHNHQIAGVIGQQGEGEIEGTYKDYEVSGPFAENFKFNRYTFRG